MTRSQRVIVWTGRFSDDQCALAVLGLYVGAWIVIGGVGLWWVTR